MISRRWKRRMCPFTGCSNDQPGVHISPIESANSQVYRPKNGLCTSQSQPTQTPPQFSYHFVLLHIARLQGAVHPSTYAAPFCCERYARLPPPYNSQGAPAKDWVQDKHCLYRSYKFTFYYTTGALNPLLEWPHTQIPSLTSILSSSRQSNDVFPKWFKRSGFTKTNVLYWAFHGELHYIYRPSLASLCFLYPFLSFPFFFFLLLYPHSPPLVPLFSSHSLCSLSPPRPPSTMAAWSVWFEA